MRVVVFLTDDLQEHLDHLPDRYVSVELPENEDIDYLAAINQFIDDFTTYVWSPS